MTLSEQRSFGTKPDMPTSFNHLAGAKQDGGYGSLNAEGPCSLQIHRQFKFRGPLDRKIGRLFAVQDPVGIGRKPEIGCALVRAIAQESADLAIFAPTKHR